jgi:hypothetical protein
MGSTGLLKTFFEAYSTVCFKITSGRCYADEGVVTDESEWKKPILGMFVKG